jgi:class 3 adenylate cyclase/tetratricopeptide (TPR) repeat protein
MPVEQRKTVTVLFSDVTGFTGLGHDLDAESLRRLMARYFERMEAVLTRHGGTVEKFIGDAVVGIFGIPDAHEDDALRAVRAAVEMQDALRELNEDFVRVWGVTLSTHTGINTGEVVAGDLGPGKPLMFGDAVNVAARLEQAASAAEILIGESTHRLVRDAVVVEPLEPLSLRGQPDPVDARRLVGLVAGAPAWRRRLDSPMVGRRPELDVLESAFSETVRGGGCRAVTVLAAAGVGKSRLAQEFAARLADRARVATGRCLAYGEGLTFWPVIELLRNVAAVGEHDDRATIQAALARLLDSPDDGPLAVERLSALLGAAESAPGIQQTFWAVRKLLESLAAREPLVVVFDDIHWAEPTFLDLIEYLVDWISGVPVLLVCLARPELAETRPGWLSGKPNATAFSLPPLDDGEIGDLMANLVDSAPIAEAACQRITQVAEGNPLFVEETFRMLVDRGLLRLEDGHWAAAGDLSGIAIPPTIHALLAARLDRLDDDERAVLERASVIGRVFWWGAVTELSAEALRPQVGSLLQALTRKDFIGPGVTDLPGEDAFQFTHILVRDATYQEIPRSVRADLHERLVDWLDPRTADHGAITDEILGYHLEQAHQCRLAIGLASPQIEQLGRRAAAHLGTAGRRAIARDDVAGGAALLSRSTELLPAGDPNRLELLLDLATALRETGSFERLSAVVAETRVAASALDDARLLARAEVLELWLRLFTNPEGWLELARRQATRAVAVLEEAGDKPGLVDAWSVLGLMHVTEARFGPAEEAWENAAAHARAAGQRRAELEALSWVLLSVWAGPVPTDQGIRRCREVLEWAQGDRKGVASALFMRAVFEAGLGHADEARALIARARALLQELGLTVWMAGPLSQMAGLVELTAGDPVAAERELRWGYTTLQAAGEMAWLSTLVAILAEALYAQGRYDEAEEMATASRDTAGSEDAYSQVLWRGISGRVLARRTQPEEAERLAREAVALAAVTDSVELQGTAARNLAEVLALGGRAAEAEAAAAHAVAAYERKGNTVAAERARRLVLGRPAESA